MQVCSCCPFELCPATSKPKVGDFLCCRVVPLVRYGKQHHMHWTKKSEDEEDVQIDHCLPASLSAVRALSGLLTWRRNLLMASSVMVIRFAADTESLSKASTSWTTVACTRHTSSPQPADNTVRRFAAICYAKYTGHGRRSLGLGVLTP